MTLLVLLVFGGDVLAYLLCIGTSRVETATLGGIGGGGNISRKLDVDYILSGRTPDMDKILSLCQAESIQKQQSGKRIGF